MTREEAIWWVNHLFEIRKEEYFNKGMMEDAKEVEEAKRMAIEALQENNSADSLLTDSSEADKERDCKLDLISRQAAIRWVKTECNPYGKPTLDFESGKKVIEHLKQMPSADAVKRVDCSNFLLWLLEEIMDEDNWELNAVADGEIIARKLKKLGLLEVKDGYYHRIFDENVWVVRCKDCRHRCKEPIYSKADVHWVIYQIGDCPIICKTVGDDDYCSFGERREP